MTHRLLAFAALAAGLTFAAPGPAAEEKKDKKTADAAKKALAEVGDFIGQWKVDFKGKIGGKEQSSNEKMEIGWKFKDGDGWIGFDIKDGKFVEKSELRFVPAKKVYELTVTEKDAKAPAVYTGKLAAGKLVVERTDSASGDVAKITIFTIDGIRMILKNEVKAGGKGAFVTAYQFTASKDGESFAGGKKKNECVVTGGTATTPVSFGGKTYYVCCSGCKAEFDANPKKYVDEFEKKNK